MRGVFLGAILICSSPTLALAQRDYSAPFPAHRVSRQHLLRWDGGSRNILGDNFRRPHPHQHRL